MVPGLRARWLEGRMDLVEQLLGDRAGDAIQGLVGQAGFSPEQAQGFLPVVIQKVMEVLQGGNLDLAALVGGSVSSLLSQLNAGELAAAAGVDEARASAGLETLLPALLSALGEQSGGLEGILESLSGGKAGGLLGAATGLAGKLFK
jgi:hypothetical protein